MKASGISRRFQRLSRSLGQVSHVLLTRSPLSPGASSGISFDLHVLGTPPAFVLSQDQTLRRDLGRPEGLPRSVCCRPQSRRIRVGGLAYVERDRRWLQQSASPDPHALNERHTDRFVTGKPVTGSPAPLNGPAFELTEDCRTSRNVLTSPALAFASVSSVFKEQSTLSADTVVPGTLFARWRTGGAVLLPRGNRLSAAVWGELLRYRPPQGVSTLFRQVFSSGSSPNRQEQRPEHYQRTRTPQPATSRTSRELRHADIVQAPRTAR